MTTLLWSVRRELWENRSVYIAPLVVAGVVLFGFALSTIGMPHRRRATLMLDPAHQKAAIAMPYDVAAVMLLVTAVIVGIFYCLDALHGERRDRSILFWKSLPVSDSVTVLSKAIIPLVVLPAVAFAIVVITQFLMLLWSSVVLLPSGLAGSTWAHYNIFLQALVVLYSVIVVALWYAPIYGWMLLVSSYAKRATFLWAVIPFLAIAVLEKIAFDTQHFGMLIVSRLIGHAALAFSGKPHGRIDSLSQLTPGTFLAAPGLWLGLLFAVACLAGAVRMRRYREPI